MGIVTPRTMPGALEFLPGDQVLFQEFLATIRRGFELFGFVPVETPALELKEILLTKSGGETEKQVYFVQSSGSLARGDPPKLALRFDLTVPLARYVAEHEQELAFPFRRYQIQRVYRGESAQKGRFREFYQCDIDVVGRGSLSLRHDAEIPAVIEHLFRELGFGPFAIHISNRKILLGLLESLGVKGARERVLVLREIDKLQKRGRAAVQETLSEEAFALGPAKAALLLRLVNTRGTQQEQMASLAAMEVDNPLFQEGVAELAAVLQALQDFKVPEDTVRVDLALARGLDYYTGTVFETFLCGHPEVGSICSGGRYDDLASHYTKSRLPGVGISIGATRLFWKLQEAGLLKRSSRHRVAVLVTGMDPALAALYRRLAFELRRSGISTVLYMESGKLGKQLRYASRLGARFAIVAGSEEQQRGTVMLKDLSRGKQEEVAQEGLAARIQERLEREA